MSNNVIQVEVVIPTQTKYLSLIGSIGEHIAKELEEFSGDREALAYHLNLVLTEATANAIKHAKDNDPKDSVKIIISLEENDLYIRVYDHGQGFDLEKVPTPDFDHPKENGMGIYFIRSLMDSVSYTRKEGCNVLEIVKHLK